MAIRRLFTRRMSRVLEGRRYVRTYDAVSIIPGAARESAREMVRAAYLVIAKLQRFKTKMETLRLHRAPT